MATFCLSGICNVLKPVEFKWSEIGIQLGIPNCKLKVFKKEDDPLTEAINYWLKGNVEGAKLCWKAIATALESPHVGEQGIAEEVKKKFCKEEITQEDEGELK